MTAATPTIAGSVLIRTYTHKRAFLNIGDITYDVEQLLHWLTIVKQCGLAGSPFVPQHVLTHLEEYGFLARHPGRPTAIAGPYFDVLFDNLTDFVSRLTASKLLGVTKTEDSYVPLTTP